MSCSMNLKICDFAGDFREVKVNRSELRRASGLIVMLIRFDMKTILDNLPANTSIILIIVIVIFLLIALIINLRYKKNIVKIYPTDTDKKNRRNFENKYNDYRKSIEWKNLEDSAFKRANNKCEICGRPAQVVHHKSYTANFKDDNLDNLLVLCNKCHYKIHRSEIEYKKRETLFSESVVSGNQHFRIEVKEARNQSKYIVISEMRADEKGRSDDIRIFIFEENIDQVNRILNKAIGYIKSKRS